MISRFSRNYCPAPAKSKFFIRMFGRQEARNYRRKPCWQANNLMLKCGIQPPEPKKIGGLAEDLLFDRLVEQQHFANQLALYQIYC